MRSNIYCNRTLNLKSIRAIGYDMDYTLVQYHFERWEKCSYDYLKGLLSEKNWPLQDLVFDPTIACRGLIIDKKLGNLVKSNRFGFIKHAYHGTRSMDLEEHRSVYIETNIDLAESRWACLNTLFSVSEGCIYAQCVDLLDQNKIPHIKHYDELYDAIAESLETTHMEGHLKKEIMANPGHFVKLTPDIPLALLDQMHSGKKILLITNSEWSYAQAMMQYAFDPFLPKGTCWKDIFDLIIVGARKPSFFTTKQQPFFEVVSEEGLLKPALTSLKKGTCYLGGSAIGVEQALNLSGSEILYVGDHIFADVHVSKNILRWRTALILHELEREIQELQAFYPQEQALTHMMKEKEQLEVEACQIRLQIQRQKLDYGAFRAANLPTLEKDLLSIRKRIDMLDEKITPLVKEAAQLTNKRWGLLMRAGNDKSYLAYQTERYADIYTASVGYFLKLTPFAYLRSQRGELPHELSMET